MTSIPTVEYGCELGHPIPTLAGHSYRAESVKGDQMSNDDLKEEIERLRAENERLKNRKANRLSLKVSEKGAVSLYGIGRFPVTLYKEQWAKIIEMTKEIEEFVRENDHLLKAKE
jgi:cell shape-determining protein MreC